MLSAEGISPSEAHPSPKYVIATPFCLRLFIAKAAPLAAGTCCPRFDLTYMHDSFGEPMCMGSCRPFVWSSSLWQHWLAHSSNV